MYGFTGTGREGRQLKLGIDPKQCMTCMSTITMSGEVLDDYYIKKGKTDRCIKPITNGLKHIVTMINLGKCLRDLALSKTICIKLHQRFAKQFRSDFETRKCLKVFVCEVPRP